MPEINKSRSNVTIDVYKSSSWVLAQTDFTNIAERVYLEQSFL